MKKHDDRRPPQQGSKGTDLPQAQQQHLDRGHQPHGAEHPGQSGQLAPTGRKLHQKSNQRLHRHQQR